MTVTLIIISLALVISIGAIIHLINRKPAEDPRLSEQLAIIEAQKAQIYEQKVINDGLTEETATLRTSLAVAQERIAAAETRLQEEKAAWAQRLQDKDADLRQQLESERALLADRFTALAVKALNDNASQIDERSKKSFEAVVGPLKANLESFQQAFRDSYSTEHNERLSLREEIASLQKLGKEMSHEAMRLSTALRGNNGVQGRWGEMVLKNILENSGLENGPDGYELQNAQTDEEGGIRPDAVIHCPGNRDIIIDSKVVITDYLRMLEADSETERQELLRNHVRAVEKQITALGSKDYQKRYGFKNGSFVFLFLPHEGAYIAAINAKPELWQKAYESNIVLASPAHLVSAVRMVEQMWEHDAQDKNLERIVQQGVRLANSITMFLSEVDGVYDAIDKARFTFDNAVKRFHTGNGNLVRTVNELASLGVKASVKTQIPKRFSEQSD